MKLAALSCQPTAQGPGKTRLELWLGLGGGSSEQCLKWGWKLVIVKIIVCKLSGLCLFVHLPFQQPSGCRGHKVWSFLGEIVSVHACVHGGVTVSLQHSKPLASGVMRLVTGLGVFFLVLGLTWDYFNVFLVWSALVLEVVPNFPAEVWKLVCSISQPLLRWWALVF